MNLDGLSTIQLASIINEEAMKAIEHGITHATHTFNAMSPLNHRKPGIVLKLNKRIKNFMDNSGMDICAAIGLVSINHARELGLDKIKGSLEKGKFADIVILDEEFNIKQTIVEGKTFYKL